jgi:hypothetical protein
LLRTWECRDERHPAWRGALSPLVGLFNDLIL